MTDENERRFASGLARTPLSPFFIYLMGGFEKDVCLSSARRSRADLYQDKHTPNRQSGFFNL